MPQNNAIADFTAATKALVTAAQAVGSHGVSSDIAEATKELDAAAKQAAQALKAKH